jgi:hypothetical protein
VGVEFIIKENVSRLEVAVHDWWGTDFMQIPAE